MDQPLTVGLTDIVSDFSHLSVSDLSDLFVIYFPRISGISDVSKSRQLELNLLPLEKRFPYL